MAESNATQVILTDDGLKIIKAQNTADNATGGITNLNDPNLMSVIEKQTQASQYAGLTSQYNVVLARAKEASISTTALTTAYTNLNTFMTAILTDTTKASDVNRDTYKGLTDAYNSALSQIQKDLDDYVNNEFSAASSQAVVADSNATAAKEAADSTYAYANSEIAVQSNATVKAQSTADSAFSQAATAIDTGNVTSQAVTDLKDGSTMTIAELGNGLATKVSNSEYASYKDQTASQIGELVTNGAFSAYKQTTADLISEKVATSDFSAYKATTAQAIESKVESSDFTTYKEQTADMISSKVSTVDFNNLTISNRNLALGTATPITFVGQNINNQAQVGYRFSSVIPLGTVVTVAFDITSSTGVGTYAMQFDGFDSGSSWQTISNGSLVNGTKHISVTLTTAGNHLHFYPRLDNATGTVTISNFIISESSKEVSWTPAPEDQATQSQITQLSGDINLRVTKDDLIDQINIQAGKTLISSSGQLTLAADTIYFDTNKPVIIPSANIDSLLVDKELTAADIAANTFSTNNETFTVDKNGAVVASNLTVRGVTNLVYNAALLGGNGSNIPGWTLNGEPYYSGDELFDGVPAIVWNGDATGRWDNYATSKLQPVTQTGIPYSASVKFRDYGSASGMLYTFSIGFFSDNGVGDRVGYVDHVYTANGSDSGIQTFTINGAIAPSNAKYVAVYINAYNGKGHVAFSSPMLTQTAQSTGYMPDTGNVVSAGEIDGSIINGSTINGTTFHGGGIISHSNNTAGYYPMTITPDGSYKSTYFDSAVGLQSSVASGAIVYKYRSMGSNSNGQYLAYDSVINGQGLNLQSGYTSAKDTTFSNPVNTTTGYVIVNANDGITLHGDDQQITFNGTSADTTPKGVIITPYGNINPNGTQNIWYVGNNMNMKTASFGMDGSGTYNIQFNRSLDIGNFNINTYHTITSSDNGPIHFNRANGNPVDIYASTVNYDSLVKSSLLSVKRDVRKADTAYWAQLVNSIDLATYQYKSDDNTSHIRLSSIVDDVNDTKQWQLPDVFVSRDEKGKLNGVDDSVLLNATLATVQEQQKEIDQLNGHNMQLEARLNKLEAKLNG